MCGCGHTYAGRSAAKACSRPCPEFQQLQCSAQRWGGTYFGCQRYSKQCYRRSLSKPQRWKCLAKSGCDPCNSANKIDKGGTAKTEAKYRALTDGECMMKCGKGWYHDPYMKIIEGWKVRIPLLSNHHL